MAKRTYNRRKTTAKKPVTSDKGRKQRVKGAETERRTGSKDRVTRGRGVTRTRTGAPRGASGPRTAPQQGPNRPSPRSLTIGGDTGRRGGVNQPARSGPPRPNTPKVPGKFVKTAAKVGTILNPKTDLPAKAVAAGSLAIDAARALRGKPKPKKVLANPWQAWAVTTKKKKGNCLVQQVQLTLTLLLPKPVVLVKRHLLGVANYTTPN